MPCHHIPSRALVVLLDHHEESKIYFPTSSPPVFGTGLVSLAESKQFALCSTISCPCLLERFHDTTKTIRIRHRCIWLHNIRNMGNAANTYLVPIFHSAQGILSGRKTTQKGLWFVGELFLKCVRIMGDTRYFTAHVKKDTNSPFASVVRDKKYSIRIHYT